MSRPGSFQCPEQRALAFLKLQFICIAAAKNVQTGQACTIDQRLFTVSAEAVGAFDGPNSAERLGPGPDGYGRAGQRSERIGKAHDLVRTEHDPIPLEVVIDLRDTAAQNSFAPQGVDALVRR